MLLTVYFLMCLMLGTIVSLALRLHVVSQQNKRSMKGRFRESEAPRSFDHSAQLLWLLLLDCLLLTDADRWSPGEWGAFVLGLPDGAVVVYPPGHGTETKVEVRSAEGEFCAGLVVSDSGDCRLDQVVLRLARHVEVSATS